MRSLRYILTFILFICYLVFHGESLSWTEQTHIMLSEHAAENTVIDYSFTDYLINNLGFKRGVEEVLTGVDAGEKNVSKEVFWWLGHGGLQEDRPGNWYDYILDKPSRSLNHFHNPTYSWNEWSQAGLDDWVGVINYTGESSVLWAQDGTALRRTEARNDMFQWKLFAKWFILNHAYR